MLLFQLAYSVILSAEPFTVGMCSLPFSFWILDKLKTETMLQLRRKSVVTQRQWLVPAGKGRPMHGRAEFLSRPGGGGLWNSARTVPSSTGSPSNGMVLNMFLHLLVLKRNNN